MLGLPPEYEAKVRSDEGAGEILDACKAHATRYKELPDTAFEGLSTLMETSRFMVPEEAVELLEHMLDWDVDARWGPEDALNNSAWLQELRDANPAAIADAKARGSAARPGIDAIFADIDASQGEELVNASLSRVLSSCIEGWAQQPPATAPPPH